MGCSKTTSSLLPTSTAGGNSTPSKVETVLASGKLNLNINNSSQISQQSLTALDSTDVIVTIGNLTNFEIYNSIKFNVSELDSVEASGKILLNMVYNDLAASNSDYKLKVYLDGSEGFTGISNANTVLPIYAKMKSDSNYTRVTSEGFAVKNWPRPTNGWQNPIDEVLEIKLSGDFKKALKQGYSAKLCIDFVEITTTPNEG
jgi:hypothetical protein